MRVLLLFSILVVGAAHAGSTDGKLFVYDFNRKIAVPWTSPPLPMRIYARYDASVKYRVYMATNAQGRFAEPAEAFLPGSVVRASWLGREGEGRYQLQVDGKWVATESPEEHWYWLEGPITTYRVVAFP